MVQLDVLGYSEKLRSNLYGGELEVQLLCNTFKAKIKVFSHHFWHDGDEGVQHQVHLPYGNAHELEFSLLHEEGMSGGTDHYSFLEEEFDRHRFLMARQPMWETEYFVGDDGSKGQGLEALRQFERGDLISWYDGHRCNEDGEIVIYRQAISDLMQQYPQIDRHATGSPFQKTHAVRVKR